MRIAVDAMGGDNAPHVVVEGVIRAFSANPDLEIQLYGPSDQVAQIVESTAPTQGVSITLVDAPQVIGMAESPTEALKNKPNSSIHLGLTAVKKGEADAFVSAGNTGALMAASLFILKRLPGVDRPTVMGAIPTTKGSSLLLDVGTNVDCKPKHLRQFALMGAVYSREILGISEPAVGLINIGEEPGKGNEQTKATYELLNSDSAINFVGNVEGRDVVHHAADVYICDGFVGNIMLKFGEALGTDLLSFMVKRQINALQLSPGEEESVVKVMRGLQKPFNYEERGGSPLLGVQGHVIVGHGSSTPRAIERMIQQAGMLAQEDVADAIQEAVSE